MFEQISTRSFVNREHSGEYAEVEFDTYISNRGKEEVEDIVTSIHYYVAGEGDPMILVHGIGQSLYTWRKNFKELSKSFHVYAVDIPGHGFSGKPEISYSIEEFALSIEAFMNACKIVSANFCAFGEACAYVLDFAIHNPERAKGLILVSPMLSMGGGMRGKGLNSVFGSAASRMMVNPQVVRNVLEECYFDRTLVTEEVVSEYYNCVADRDFKAISRMCMGNFMDEEVVAGIYTVKSPILVIVGNDDKVTGGPDSNFLDLGFEKGSFLNVRNCGYLVHEEKPEKVNDAIKTFLGVK